MGYLKFHKRMREIQFHFCAVAINRCLIFFTTLAKTVFHFFTNVLQQASRWIFMIITGMLQSKASNILYQTV